MNEKIRKIFRNPKSIAYRAFFYIGTHQDEHLLYISILSRHTKIKYTSLHYWITKFKQEGLINKQLEFTSRGNKLFKFLWEMKDVKLLRAHNIQIIFYLSSCPVEFVKRYSDKVFTVFTNKKFMGLNGEVKTPYGIISIMFYSRKKIVCVLKDIFGETDEDISSAIASQVPDVIQLLESTFKGIKVESHKPARIQTSHIAVINSNFAKRFDLNSITYEGKNIAMDRSQGNEELELTNPRNNLLGIEFLKKLEEGLDDL
ncbi:MAG: hypothetical protein ABIH65_03425 [Nanoarchaeota archaeon]